MAFNQQLGLWKKKNAGASGVRVILEKRGAGVEVRLLEEYALDDEESCKGQS